MVGVSNEVALMYSINIWATSLDTPSMFFQLVAQCVCVKKKMNCSYINLLIFSDVQNLFCNEI